MSKGQSKLVRDEPHKTSILEPRVEVPSQHDPLIANEPALQGEDTQARILTYGEAPYAEQPERGGCSSAVLSALVALLLIGMFVTSIALAGFVGYRDGGLARQTLKAAALSGTLSRQATLAWQDLGNSAYELALARCQFLLAQQPFFPEANSCLATAQAGLSVTPTVLPTATSTTIATTAPVTNPTAPSGGFTPDQLYAQAQDAVAKQDLEGAVAWLEALRGLDGNYRRADVEPQLVNIYLMLAARYEAQNDLSKMIIVVEKAQALTNLASTKWPFTINVAKLYLSAKGYYEAQNYPEAARVFKLLLTQSSTYQTDIMTMACDSFAKIGDSGALQQYNCP